MDQPRAAVDMPFIVLSALFVAALVVCNLIANKFVSIDLGFREFTLSAGALPYPITFLVTDLLSEIYGRRRANQVVIAGFIASLFVLGVLWMGGQFAAIEESPVDDATYHAAFRNAWRVIGASMVACRPAAWLLVTKMTPPMEAPITMMSNRNFFTVDLLPGPCAAVRCASGGSHAADPRC